MRVDSAIDFEALCFFEQWTDRSSLVEHGRNEALTTKAWVDAHDQHKIEGVDNWEYFFDIGRWIDDDSGPIAHFSEFLSQVSRLLFALHDFDMETDEIGPIGVERPEEHLGIGHHEVHIEKGVGASSSTCPADGRPHREIGDKVPIHDIDMEEIGACLDNLLAFSPKIGKVGGQNRGGNECFRR